MSDDELIDLFDGNISERALVVLEVTESQAERLIALARIGAAVKPRPIAEMSPEIEDAYVYYAPDEVWSRGCAVYCDGRLVHSGNPIMPLNKGYTHFIPLSALPQPEPTP